MSLVFDFVNFNSRTTCKDLTPPIKGVFDNAANLPHMDPDMALVIVKDMQSLKECYKQAWEAIQDLKKELGTQQDIS